jgi:hypothetical protein
VRLGPIFSVIVMGMLGLLLSWLVLAVAMMLIGLDGRRRTAGMPLAYFLGLSLIHVPGAAVYLDFPMWDVLARRTQTGFEQTVIGMAVFLAGVMLARCRARLPDADQEPRQWRASDLAALDRLALVYVAGGTCYFLLGSFVSIPSVGAIIASLVSLLIVGASLRLWISHRQGRMLKFWTTVALLGLFPVITIIRSGFIGFGTYWMLAAMSFAYALSKRRLGYFLLAPFAVYLGMSVFVNYMASRTAFRQAVWMQQVGLADRFVRLQQMFANFQWLDSENPKQREVIDGRLNQNLLVGAAVERLELGQVSYARGSTLVTMALGLIPRALWPDKPQVGGGGTVVRDYAGLRFLEGTSVGAGQVLEFYVNFGTLGVIGSFLLYGYFIGWMDLRIIISVDQGDQKGFLLWFMICLALLQPGGNLVEIVVTVAGSAVTANVLAYLLNRRFRATQSGSRTALILGR